MILAETLETAEAVAFATASAGENLSNSGPNLAPFYIIGIIAGLALAVFLAIRKANKIYGKGW